jgi:SSS family transporter
MNFNTIASWAISLSYFIILMWIGVVASKKIKDFRGYIIGGRDIGFWVFSVLIIATCMSGMSILGSSGLGYVSGWPSIWEQIFVPLACSLTIFLFGAKLHRIAAKHNYLTLQDYLAHRFESPRLIRGLTGFAVFSVSLIYLVGQYTAIGITLQQVLKVPYSTAVIMGAVIVTFYVFFGGLYAVSWTSLVQGLILIFGVLVIAPVVIIKAGGLAHINANIAAVDPNFIKAAFPQVHPPYAPYAFMTPLYILSFACLLSLGLAAAPHVVNNILTARKNAYFKWSPVIVFVVYVIIFYLIKIVGFASRSMVIDGMIALPTGVSNPPDFSFIVAVEHCFGPVMWTFFGMIVLSAVMSTTDRLLLTIGTSMAWDVYKNLLKPDATDKQVTRISQFTVFVAAVLSIILALRPPSLLAWLIWMGIGVMLCVFVIPILAGLYWKRANRQGAVWSMIIGFVSAIIFGYIGKYVTTLPFHFSFIPFLIAIVVMVVVSITGKRPDPAIIKETETGMYI